MYCPLSVNGLPRMTIGERGSEGEVGERLIQRSLGYWIIRIYGESGYDYSGNRRE